uniref:BZIP domain-containing protein n=1 Tax=Hyaloperonospora arabidopsidis (strain Emoy2) TaxID=559515 RepID=M4B7J2_HYAAE
MESLYAIDSAYLATPSPSPYTDEYSSIYAHPTNSSLVSSPSEDASSSVLSDDPMAELPPASLDQDWDGLSDIFIDEALSSLLPSSMIDLDQGLEFMTQDTINDPQYPQSEATSSSPFSGALLVDSNNSKCSPLIEEVPQLNLGSTKPAKHSQKVKKARRERGRGKKSVSTAASKKSSVSPEEQKKQKRRSQIASGVQRHREKKKWLVSSLQTEMAELTTQLATLRAKRRAQLAFDDDLVAYEEEAMTQQRKRKQAEQDNHMLKYALFQQSVFLRGMQAVMRGSNVLLSKTLEFHDWVHSYTTLSSSDALVRRKEYVGHFPKSKMELARNIVVRSTDEQMQRSLSTRQKFSGIVRIVHDGTRQSHEIDEDYADSTIRELYGRPNGGSAPTSSKMGDGGGDGRVIKEFASVSFYPETPVCTLDTLMDTICISMKSLGLYYAGVSYEAQAADEVHYVEDNGMTDSSVYYSSLASSMEPVFDVVDEADSAENIDVEARVLTRVQRTKDEGIILWDYVDEDFKHPLPVDSPYRKAINRNVCGAIVVRREIGFGVLSIRHVSIKAYCRLPPPKCPTTGAGESSEAEEIRRAVARRIGLQAAEYERTSDRCMRYVYNDIISRLKQLALLGTKDPVPVRGDAFSE